MAENNECILHDTKIIKNAMAKKEDFITRYDDIRERYRETINTLLENWKGEGADAFAYDTNIIGKNINNLYDILRAMSDMLQDCVDMLEKKSNSLKAYNEKL